MSRPEVPIENPRKYGGFDDDFGAQQLADFLRGERADDGVDTSPRPQPQGTDEVDEDFLRKIGNPDNHYGR